MSSTTLSPTLIAKLKQLAERGCWGDDDNEDMKTGAYDYGQPSGPGHADCVRNCKNGMQPCLEDYE